MPDDDQQKFELRNMFNEFDTDGSGQIDEYELFHAMKALGIKTVTQSSAKKLLKAFFKKANDPEAIKKVLSKQSQRSFDYKQLVLEGDPNFQKFFTMPPSTKFTKKFELHGETVVHVAWLSDSLLISAAMDGEVMVWNMDATGKRPQPDKIIEAQHVPLYAMAVCPDAKNFATGSGAKTDNLKLWTLADEPCRPSRTFKGHESEVYSLVWSLSGDKLLSGSKDGTLCVHNVTVDAAQVSLKAHDGVLQSLALDKVGFTLCTASSDGAVNVYDLRELENASSPVFTLEEAASSAAVYKAVFRGEKEIVSCGDDFCIKRWDMRMPKDPLVQNYFGHTTAVRSLAMSDDGNYFASGTHDGSVRVWLADELGLIQDQWDQVHTQLKPLMRQYSRQQELVASGEADPRQVRELTEQIKQLSEQMKFYEKAKAERTSLACTQAKLGLAGHNMQVESLAWRFRSNGSVMLASGSTDQTMKLFEVDTSKLKEFELWDPA
eukprot:TRINITY_DN39468_c0_g1_i1.p1 TRINITY_DN39468_c0_g1~~TRINITY_DN39468_c0_g1_i1.p1  ORF type:complete len:491 (-),score=122.01 TRINITY_DN39468_c0_g1_i1:88-1560(-)